MFFTELNCTSTSVFPYNEDWENRQIVIIAIIVIIIIARRIVKSAAKEDGVRRGKRYTATSITASGYLHSTVPLI